MSMYLMSRLAQELSYQKSLGYNVNDDAKKSLGDFLVFCQTYLDRAVTCYSGHDENAKLQAEGQLIKVYALIDAYFSRYDLPEAVEYR